VKIMLDCSPAKITRYRERYGHDFWQLRTPLTRNKIADVPYGLDNGCFSEFKRATWERMLDEAEERRPVFVALPDIVGDARRTLDLFDQFQSNTGGLPRALVLQDGIGDFSIPWHELDAVFVGGTDAFKLAPECLNACRAAKMLGKWVHVGRVNDPRRAANWRDVADSIDGSGISRYDHMLEEVLHIIEGSHPQAEIPIHAEAG
jgi:hypothetical protein